MIKLSYGFSVALLLGAAVVMVQSQVVIALTPAEVNAIAKQITVRIDGANTGSGIIIDRQGNTYTVITNEHVVRLKGNYTLQTPDGRRYSFNQSIVKYFPGVDLAVLKFTSTENYRTPELGNSQQVSEGMTTYVAGWANPDAVSPERSYTFLPGGISRIVRNAKNGYDWVHTNPTKLGMSGGPVLDEEGRLVGINGLSLTNPGTGATDYFGIPINTYLQLAAKQGGNQQATKPSSPPSRNTVATSSSTTTSLDIFAPVYSFAISPDGRTLASGSNEKTIKIWNLATGQLIRTLQGHSNVVYSVAISPDGRTLVSGSRDKTIKIWRVSKR